VALYSADSMQYRHMTDERKDIGHTALEERRVLKVHACTVIAIKAKFTHSRRPNVLQKGLFMLRIGLRGAICSRPVTAVNYCRRRGRAAADRSDLAVLIAMLIDTHVYHVY